MTTNYTGPITYASLAAGSQPLSDFDTSFDSTYRMGTLQCSAAGTNTVTLTALSGYPQMVTYGALQKIGFIASATSTSATTLQFSGLTAKNAYKNDGVTQIGAGDQALGSYYEYAYNPTLNSSAGGFQQITAPVTATGFIKSVKKQVILASGTYTPSSGMAYITAELQAAGGNGGGPNVGSGGGAGGYGKSLFTAADVGASQSVTLGGHASNSLFGAFITCTAGSDGGNTATGNTGVGGGAGGSSSGANMVNISGNTGGVGLNGSGAPSMSGPGGSSQLGAGGAAVTSNSAGLNAPAGYGAGGGGALNNATVGLGSPAACVITEFCTS